jgi:GT2 family glycosyltransferase
LFSVVIITFNSEQFIKSCLDSVFVQGYPDFEVIVVDNGSNDGTANLIRRDYPRVILVENRENLGACRARNQGIEVSKSEWILTLDCDVVLDEGFLSETANKINYLPDRIGIIQPKIFSADRKTIYSAGISLSYLRRFHDIGKRERDTKKFGRSKYVYGACAAAAFYKRQMLEELRENTGYFDERFFFMVEDVDLAWRANRKRWKALFYPGAVCYHNGGSAKTDNKLRQYFCFRNRYYSIIKNDGLAKYAAKIIPLFFYDFPRICFLSFTNPYLFRGRKLIRQAVRNK